MPVRSIAIEIDEARIDAIFAELDQCHLPGAVVGLAVEGKPVYRKGFGLASLELPVALSASLRMRIGSTSKHFACLAYLLLCEEGRANIDDALGAYLPELHPVSRGVTLRQLMGNSSGLRDVHDVCWQFSGRGHAVSSAELLELYRDIDDVNAAPGASWIYCNGGFLLLSAVIERIAGKPLEAVLRERVFEPVGMDDTLLRRWDTDFVANSATLHMSKLNGGYERWYLGTALAGEGGVVSTVDDMLRWLAHMDHPVVGNAATWAMMMESQRLNDGCLTGYGLGLFSTNYRGVRTVHHPGGVMGGNAQMLKVPDAGLDVAVMVNRHDVSAVTLVEKILDACLVSIGPASKAAEMRLVEGVFQSKNTGRVVQLFARAGQQMASINGVDMAVEFSQDGLLWPAAPLRFLKQSITPCDDCERPASIRYNHFGSIDELVAVTSVTQPDTRRILGRYRCDAAHSEVLITGTGGSVDMYASGKFGATKYQLECIAEGIWRAKSKHPTPRDGIYTFDVDGRAAHFSNDRIWRLRFLRQPA